MYTVGGENMHRNLISETDSGVSSGALNNQGTTENEKLVIKNLWFSQIYLLATIIESELQKSHCDITCNMVM